MSPFLGAEIEGVNLCGALSSEMYAAINNALLEHIVVIVRDQKLSPKAYVEVMSQFGVPGKQSHEYRKDKHPFHPSPTADDCWRIARQLCNTSPNPAAVEPGALESSPFLQPSTPPAIRHNESLPRWPERSILDATGGNWHFGPRLRRDEHRLRNALRKTLHSLDRR
jgi:hypothetical protein